MCVFDVLLLCAVEGMEANQLTWVTDTTVDWPKTYLLVFRGLSGGSSLRFFSSQWLLSFCLFSWSAWPRPTTQRGLWLLWISSSCSSIWNVSLTSSLISTVLSITGMSILHVKHEETDSIAQAVLTGLSGKAKKVSLFWEISRQIEFKWEPDWCIG